MLLLWTSCCCRLGWLTWVSVAEVKRTVCCWRICEFRWMALTYSGCTTSAFAHFSHLSCGWVYSPFLQQYEKVCGEVHRENFYSSLECVQGAHKQPDPSTERLAGKACHQWSSLCLFCYSSVQFPYECKTFLFPKGSCWHWNMKQGLSVLSVRMEPSFQGYF